MARYFIYTDSSGLDHYLINDLIMPHSLIESDSLYSSLSFIISSSILVTNKRLTAKTILDTCRHGSVQPIILEVELNYKDSIDIIVIENEETLYKKTIIKNEELPDTFLICEPIPFQCVIAIHQFGELLPRTIFVDLHLYENLISETMFTPGEDEISIKTLRLCLDKNPFILSPVTDSTFNNKLRAGYALLLHFNNRASFDKSIQSNITEAHFKLVNNKKINFNDYIANQCMLDKNYFHMHSDKWSQLNKLSENKFIVHIDDIFKHIFIKKNILSVTQYGNSEVEKFNFLLGAVAIYCACKQEKKLLEAIRMEFVEYRNHNLFKNEKILRALESLIPAEPHVLQSRIKGMMTLDRDKHFMIESVLQAAKIADYTWTEVNNYFNSSPQYELYRDLICFFWGLRNGMAKIPGIIKKNDWLMYFTQNKVDQLLKKEVFILPSIKDYANIRKISQDGVTNLGFLVDYFDYQYAARVINKRMREYLVNLLGEDSASITNHIYAFNAQQYNAELIKFHYFTIIKKGKVNKK